MKDISARFSSDVAYAPSRAPALREISRHVFETTSRFFGGVDIATATPTPSAKVISATMNFCTSLNGFIGGSFLRSGTVSATSESTAASPRHIPAPGICPATGKLQFSTANEAHNAQHGLQRSGHVRHYRGCQRVVRAYQCKHCRKWHLTAGDRKNV